VCHKGLCFQTIISYPDALLSCKFSFPLCRSVFLSLCLICLSGARALSLAHAPSRRTHAHTQVPLHVRAQAEAWELPREEVCTCVYMLCFLYVCFVCAFLTIPEGSGTQRSALLHTHTHTTHLFTCKNRHSHTSHMHIHTRTQAHTHIRTGAHMHTHIRTHTNTRTCTHAHART